MSVNHNICVYKDTEYAHIQCLSGFCSDHCMLVITSTVAQLTSCFCFRMSWKRKILQFGNSNRRSTACLFVTISCPCVSVFCSRNWTRHMLAARNTRSEDGCFLNWLVWKKAAVIMQNISVCNSDTDVNPVELLLQQSFVHRTFLINLKLHFQKRKLDALKFCYLIALI